MKKLSLYTFLVLLWCNVGFADQDYYSYSFMDKDGYERFVEVWKGAVLLCDSSKKRKAIKYIFDYENQTMTTFYKGNDDSYDTNIVGSRRSGIFSYSMFKTRGDGAFLEVKTSNLDNHFIITTKTIPFHKLSDLKKFDNFVNTTLRRIDRNIENPRGINASWFLFVSPKKDKFGKKRNDDKEKEKFDAIVEFMSTLGHTQIVDQKCHGTTSLFIKDGVILDSPLGPLTNEILKNLSE